MKKFSIITFVAVSVFVVALIVLASIFDLQISRAIADLNPGEYYTTNFFAILFEIIGETFLYIFLAFALSVIFWWAIYFCSKWLKIFLGAITCVGIFGSFFYFLLRLVHYISNYQVLETGEFFFVMFVFVAIILTFLILMAVKNLKKETILQLLKFALIILFVALLSNLITQAVKGEVFGRMRYRAMNQIEDFSYFTPWFYLNGTSIADQVDLAADAFKSFPSGHTTAAAITFTLIALPIIFEKLRTRLGKIICYGTPVLITAVVAFSRIVAGAHFLSDVLFGALITFCSTFLFIYMFFIFPNKKKKLKSNKLFLPEIELN